jgi:hypothetical protein
MNNDTIIRKAKDCIDDNNYERLQEIYERLIKENREKREYRPNFEYVFQKIYLYACIKGDKDVIEWMKRIYETFGDVEKIALKPTLIYGKYILK